MSRAKQSKTVKPSKSLYMACAWFNDEQIAFMKAGYDKLKQNATVAWDSSYRPLDHQYKGINVEEHPEYLHDVEWSSRTFLSDVGGMNMADVGVFLFNPKSPDIGMGFEIGYFYAIHKPLIIVVPDEEYDKEPINLMPALGATAVIKLSDLSNYDFNAPFQDTYTDAVY